MFSFKELDAQVNEPVITAESVQFDFCNKLSPLMADVLTFVLEKQCKHPRSGVMSNEQFQETEKL